MRRDTEVEHGGGEALGPLGQTDSFPNDAELSRTLMESSSKGVLSTLTGDGYPYGSLVSCVVSGDGNPILLISDLADQGESSSLKWVTVD